MACALSGSCPRHRRVRSCPRSGIQRWPQSRSKWRVSLEPIQYRSPYPQTIRSMRGQASRSASRSMPTRTALCARSSSRSIRSSARVRLRGQVAEACREQLQPSSLSGFRTGESGAYGGEGWLDDRCHQHRDRHHHRRNNRCARDHLLRPERIASVAASTGPRLAPRGCLGCPRALRSGPLVEVPEHELINSHEVLVAIRAAAVSERSQVPE